MMSAAVASKLRQFLACLACAVLATLSAPLLLPVDGALAAKVKSITLTEEQTAAILRINQYINSFQSLRGDFVQTSPKGRTARGQMLISKPGKLRFEYAAPSQLLIVADGKWLSITNKAKTKGDQVPLNSTPLRLMVAPKIDLLKETAIVGFEQAEGITTVTLAEKKGKQAGQIILVYDENAGELRQWVVVDGKGQRTTVEVSNLEKNVKLDAKLFNANITRPEKNR